MKEGMARSRRFKQAGHIDCSPAAMGWLDELNWQLHISLLILLSMHTRGKKISAPQYSADRGLRECLVSWILSQKGKFRAEVQRLNISSSHPPTAL